MWLSAEKRRALAKETSGLPYLSGSKEQAEKATQIREEILEKVFDQYIKPDQPDADVSMPSRWNRARRLWKALLTEKRASYFIELKASKYLEWIETGEPFVLPCTAEEIETLNSAMPELVGEKTVVQLAKEVRAALLKSSDALEQRLLQGGVQAAKRLKLREIRDTLRKVTDPQWFIKRQPKVFVKYEDLLRSWLESKKSS